MSTYMIIDPNALTCTNLIVWDGQTSWTPPDGQVVQSWDNSSFVGCQMSVVAQPAQSLKLGQLQSSQNLNQSMMADLSSGVASDGNTYQAIALPDAPSNLSATVGSQQISLSWTADPNATQYLIIRNDNKAYNTTTSSYVDTGLVSGTQYTYTVQSLGVNGYGPVATISGTSL